MRRCPQFQYRIPIARPPPVERQDHHPPPHRPPRPRRHLRHPGPVPPQRVGQEAIGIDGWRSSPPSSRETSANWMNQHRPPGSPLRGTLESQESLAGAAGSGHHPHQSPNVGETYQPSAKRWVRAPPAPEPRSGRDMTMSPDQCPMSRPVRARSVGLAPTQAAGLGWYLPHRWR
jgi:hypothetical protein